jgi:hypothetical protein
MGIRTFVDCLHASGSSRTANLIRTCFLPTTTRTLFNTISAPRLTQLLGIDLSDRNLHVGSSLIHKGTIITRHYRIRKVAPWAIVQFAWMQLIVHPRMHRGNQVGEAHVRAHHIVLLHALTYSCVFLTPLIA